VRWKREYPGYWGYWAYVLGSEHGHPPRHTISPDLAVLGTTSCRDLHVYRILIEMSEFGQGPAGRSSIGPSIEAYRRYGDRTLCLLVYPNSHRRGQKSKLRKNRHFLLDGCGAGGDDRLRVGSDL
jgi:hypothetical protein